MKRSLSAIALCSSFILCQNFAFASDHPDGEVVFYNATSNPVTAQVSTFGKVTIAANESKNVAYSTLSQACSANPTNCKAKFYVNDMPAGYATLNVVTGKLVNINLSMKVRTAKGPQQVLRSVVIK